ncbi:MAG: hypothetical protein IT317_08975, partial [Anaerolineales bacterium]|nr:hypothetical protein [Anaerolineales bacterium]
MPLLSRVALGRAWRAALAAPLLLAAAALAGPGAARVAAEPANTADAKISPWVLAHTPPGETAEFLVVLARQADLSGAAALPTKAEKGRFVYETLRRVALAT